MNYYFEDLDGFITIHLLEPVYENNRLVYHVHYQDSQNGLINPGAYSYESGWKRVNYPLNVKKGDNLIINIKSDYPPNHRYGDKYSSGKGHVLLWQVVE